VAGSFEHGNEPWGSIKGKEFIDQLSDCYMLTLKNKCKYTIVWGAFFFSFHPFWCHFPQINMVYICHPQSPVYAEK
jgi:hypothetical protein